jgi:hypothetical protein
LKKKCVDSRVNVNILASTSVTLILTTVQVPNLALTHKKWITVRVDAINEFRFKPPLQPCLTKSIVTLPSFGPDFQPVRVSEERFAFISLGKIQFLPPCVSDLLFMSYSASGEAMFHPYKKYNTNPALSVAV